MAPGRLEVACLALLGGFSAFSLTLGDRRILAYLLTWSLLAALVRTAHRRWPLPPTTLGLLRAASAVHQVAHAAISAVVTPACFHLLGHLLDQEKAPAGVRAVLAMLMGWGFGAGNELYEFLSSLRFEDAYVGDLTNACWDLAFNTAGSVTAAVLCALSACPCGPATCTCWRSRRRHRRPAGRST